MISEISGVSEIASIFTERSISRNYGFDQVLINEINTVDDKVKIAEQNVAALSMNENSNVHDVMLSVQDAKLSLQLLMKIRDSALEGLQDILKMQI